MLLTGYYIGQRTSKKNVFTTFPLPFVTEARSSSWGENQKGRFGSMLVFRLVLWLNLHP